MILTHLLAFIALPPVALGPAHGLLAPQDSGAVLGSGRSDPALLPRLKVRAEPALLPVRGT